MQKALRLELTLTVRTRVSQKAPTVLANSAAGDADTDAAHAPDAETVKAETILNTLYKKPAHVATIDFL